MMTDKQRLITQLKKAIELANEENDKIHVEELKARLRHAIKSEREERAGLGALDF